MDLLVRNRINLGIGLIFAAAAALIFLRPVQVISQSNTAPAATMQFRIGVGYTDAEPKTYKGQVSVSGGELANIKGWRFSQDDSAQPGGQFALTTKMGQLENQLLKQFPYGQTDWNDPNAKRLIPEGIIVQVRGGESARVSVESSAGVLAFRAEQVPFGKMLSEQDGNVRVERMPVEETLSEKGKADDYPSIAIGPDGSRWVAWLAYESAADEVLVSGGGQIHRLSGRGDHHAPAIAYDGKDRVQVVWSRNDNGTWHLYGAAYRNGAFSKPERLTSGDGSNIWPRIASDGSGNMAVVWQGFRKNQGVILGRRWDGSAWGAETQLSEGAGNCWTPSVAFGGGKLWVAWDSYASGAYQVYAREWGKGIERITRGDEFSVRASVAVTTQGVPFVAWEESDALWGKDYAFLFDRRGNTLYRDRRVRVAFREGATWKETGASVNAAMPVELRRYIQQPELAADKAGRIYLLFRSRVTANSARIDNWASGGRWETFLTSLDGDRWSAAVAMPSSVGRNSMRAAIAVAGDRVHVAWPTDQRPWPGIKYGDLEVKAATLSATAAPAKLGFSRPIEMSPAKAENPNPNEAEDTRRIRGYRYALNGKNYRILRGDLHRHTELSSDGAGDGSLDDLYRYFLDAASMDYAHVGDHQMGGDEEYNWWITQKSNDLYYMPQRLVPMYGYERSVWWPNGHRNVVWAERGKPVLKIAQAEAKGGANSGPIIYPYLRDTKGIATSHSSATEQGTDWRDNDPDLEPLVEIYQGFESSYEAPGAPRAWKEGEKTVHQGLKPLGFIWNAWAKGFKLGVQASSDHVSTHVSYALILAEDFTRQGLLDAMRKRHAYAATDNIIVDFRAQIPEGTMLMGDIADSTGAPKLVVKVTGTAAVKQIDVIKNNKYVHKVNPAAKEASFEYVDQASGAGESYYYVRVEQADGQLAWSSPVWVRRK